jgi:hypothetical protein
MLYPTVLRCSTVFQPIITVYAYIVKVSHDHVLLVRICNNLMHMWHHVTNHLIISNDKDTNSENRIKLCVRDTDYMGHERVDEALGEIGDRLLQAEVNQYRRLARKRKSFEESIRRLEDQMFTNDVERRMCMSWLEAARAVVRIQHEMQDNTQVFHLSPWSLERGCLP